MRKIFIFSLASLWHVLLFFYSLQAAGQTSFYNEPFNAPAMLPPVVEDFHPIHQRPATLGWKELTNTVYYSQGSLDPANLSSWNTGRSGGGSAPVAFNAGDFVIQNGHNMHTTTTWALGATGFKLQIENGGILTANHAVTLTSGTTFQIDNGGTYIHNNTTAASSTIFAGTESFAPSSNVRLNNWATNSTVITTGVTLPYGNLEINWTGNTQNWQQSFTGTINLTAGDLTFTSVGTGSFRFSATGAPNITIGGNLNVNCTGLINLGSSTNGALLTVGGDVNQTAGTMTTSGSGYGEIITNTSGSNTWNLGGGTRNFIVFRVSAGKTIALGSDFNLGTPSGNGFVLTVNGTLDANSKVISIGPGGYQIYFNGTLKTANPNGFSGSALTTIDSTNNPSLSITSASTIEYNGTGAQTITARTDYNNLTISGNRNNSTVTLPSATIELTGTFGVSVTNAVFAKTGNTIHFKGSSQTIPAFNYYNLDLTAASSVAFTTSGTIGVAGTFNPATTTSASTGSTIDFNGTGSQSIPAFIFDNAAVSNNATGVSVSNNFTVNGSLTVNGKLIFATASATTSYAVSGTGSFALNSGATIAIASDLGLDGHITLSGIKTCSAGANYQYVRNATGAQVTGSLLPSIITGSLTIALGATANNALTLSSNTKTDNLVLNAGSLNIGANVLSLNNALSRITGSIDASNGTIVFSGSTAQNIPAPTFSGGMRNLTINNANGVTFNANHTITNALTLTSGVVTFAGSSLTLGSNATLNRSNGALAAVPIFPSSIDMIYNGTGDVATGPELPASSTVIRNLTINRSGDVTLGAPVTINGQLMLTAGNIILGSNNLILASTSSLNGGSVSSHLIINSTGSVVRNALPANTASQLFPVGISAASYSPATLSNTGIQTDWTVNVVNGIVPASTYNTDWAIQRTWGITPAIATTANLSFGYNEADPNILGSSWVSNRDVIVNHYNTSGGRWEMAGGLPTSQTAGGVAGSVRTVSISGQNNFSPFAVSEISHALPAVFYSFIGTRQAMRNVLSWTTITEMHNRGFELQRSDEGSLFTTLVFIKSKATRGNSSVALNYNYTDADTRGDRQYYRLRQIDLDGNETYSAIVKITGPINAEAFNLVNLRPNPTSGPGVKLSLQMFAKDDVTLTITDKFGRVVKTWMAHLEAGLNVLTIDVNKIIAGSYILSGHLIKTRKSFFTKLVKQ